MKHWAKMVRREKHLFILICSSLIMFYFALNYLLGGCGAFADCRDGTLAGCMAFCDGASCRALDCVGAICRCPDGTEEKAACYTACEN